MLLSGMYVLATRTWESATWYRTLGELDCGEIDPDAWRKWLALEIIALGVRHGMRDQVHLLPDGEEWEGMFKGE